MKRLQTLFLGLISTSVYGAYFHPRYYLESLESDNEIKAIANNLKADSIEERIARTYYFMQKRLHYVPDPMNVELIKKPIDTFYYGGDCEDLTLLAIGFFNEINVKSYFVLAPSHVFALVGPVDSVKLVKYLPYKRTTDIKGINLYGEFYTYFDVAVKNGYPGYIDNEHLESLIIADPKTKEIIAKFGKEVKIIN